MLVSRTGLLLGNKTSCFASEQKTKVRSCTKVYLLLNSKFRIFLVFGQVCNEFQNDLNKKHSSCSFINNKNNELDHTLSRIWLGIFRNSLVQLDINNTKR